MGKRAAAHRRVYIVEYISSSIYVHTTNDRRRRWRWRRQRTRKVFSESLTRCAPRRCWCKDRWGSGWWCVYTHRAPRRRRRRIEVHQTAKYHLARHRHQFPCVFGIADLHSPDEIIHLEIGSSRHRSRPLPLHSLQRSHTRANERPAQTHKLFYVRVHGSTIPVTAAAAVNCRRGSVHEETLPRTCN